MTNANAEQQGIIQNAVLQSQANLVEADANTKLATQNSKAFLQTDMANLNAQQQVNVLQAQQEQQRMLSNQAATNAAAQLMLLVQIKQSSLWLSSISNSTV